MIGILDSGIGGLSVWAEIVRLLPFESILYYADTKNCPYGSRSPEQILSFSRTCVEWLVARGVGIVVVACNTITGAAIDNFRAEFPSIRFVGMEPAIKPAATASRSGVVGVLATKATLSGHLYLNTKALMSGVKLVEVAGEGLVELVESGQQNSPEAEVLLEEYLRPMIAAGADGVVLGCTHYPFLKRAIKKIIGPSIRIVDPAPAVARRTKFLMEKYSLFKGEAYVPGQHVFYSSAGPVESLKVEQIATKLLENGN
ncbi:MAG: glutamate racemase [Mucinivorans sp.]